MNFELFFWGLSLPRPLLWREPHNEITLFTTIMACGSKIYKDVHYIVIRLSLIMKLEAIAMYTGVSEAFVLRILQYFALHGIIEHKKKCKKKNGHLCDMDVEVSCSVFGLTISC